MAKSVETPILSFGGSSNDAPDTVEIDKLSDEHSQQVAMETPKDAQTGEQPTVPKKRGRPVGSKNRPRDGSVSQASKINDIKSLIPKPIAKAVLAAPYAIIATRYGEHWNLSESEAEALIDPHLALAAKYLPDYLKENPELYACLLLHGMIIFAKMEMHYRLKREKVAMEIPKVSDAKNNPVPRQDGLRQEFSSFGVHKASTPSGDIQ